jgi:purine-binding chemotaxis protein CheW
MQQLVVFSLGQEEYGLPITQVQEIIRYTEPRTIPSAYRSVRGVINLRGKIIPVCDLRERLGLSGEPGSEGKIVILESATGTAGVIVDEVDEVLTVDDEQLEEPPAARGEHVRAVAKVDERLLVLLDPDELLAEFAASSASLGELAA